MNQSEYCAAREVSQARWGFCFGVERGGWGIVEEREMRKEKGKREKGKGKREKGKGKRGGL